MSNNPRNDIYYTASLLEYLSRKTKNRRADVARLLGVKGIAGVYEFAEVNHCLSFDQVADELIEACPEKVTIPMNGRAESLNAATAAAILMWEMMRGYMQ